MRPIIPSPRTGLTLDAALSVFGSSDLLQRLRKYEHAKDPINTWLPPSSGEDSHRVYWDARTLLEAELIEKLRSGDLYATGLEVPVSPSSTREIINSDLWHVLKLKLEDSAAEGAGLRMVDVLVHDSADSDTLSILAADPLPEFVWNDDYTFVQFGNCEFHFGILQARFVECLHGISQTADPWGSGKSILADVGAKTASVGDLFRRHQKPSWRVLIDEKRGLYGLRPHRSRTRV